MDYKQKQIAVAISNWLHVSITISKLLSYREGNSNKFGCISLVEYALKLEKKMRS